MRKIIIPIISIILILSLTSCSHIITSEKNHSAIYNDDKKIIDDDNKFIISNDQQTIKKNSITCTSDFSGVDKIWTIDLKNDESIEISYTINVSSGKAKLVFIDSDRIISTIAETEGKTIHDKLSTVSITAKKGVNNLKIVAANSKQLDFKVICNAGEFNELGDLDF